MKMLYSSLEANVIKGILIKKGNNLISDKAFQILESSPVFKNYLKYKHIFLIEDSKPKQNQIQNNEPPLDFNSMTYPELKKYVTENKIEVPSMKKEDILSVLNK